MVAVMAQREKAVRMPATPLSVELLVSSVVAASLLAARPLILAARQAAVAALV